jgi:hypothetical protein
MHLAQVNIAWLHAPMDDPEMAGLADRVDELNGLAEASKGFVWRLPGSQVNHEGLEAFSLDFPGFRRDRLFYNLSVWESVEDLHAYTYASDHTEMLNARKQWLDHVEGTSLALWWIPIGHRPTIAESAERLRAIRKSGPTIYAFTLRKPFPAPVH